MDKIVIKGKVYTIYSMEVQDKDLVLYLKHQDSDKEYGETYSDDRGYYRPYTETAKTTKAVLRVQFSNLYVDSEPKIEIFNGED